MQIIAVLAKIALVGIFIGFSLFLSTVKASDRIALLIANEDYGDKVGHLTNPHNDIKILGEALATLQFEVTPVLNADYATLARSIQRHIAKVRAAGPGAISLVYYSGHGAADANTQINYLIPVDVPSAEDSSLWQNSVPLKADVLDKLSSEAPNATHFVVFDACRNELRLTIKDQKVFEIDRKGFVPVTSSGLLVAYSTAERRTASDKGEGSGPYARALAEELRQPGVEAVMVFRNVQLRVKQSTGQDPYLSFPGVPRIFLAGEGPAETRNNSLVVERQEADRAAFERERASAKATLQSLMQQLGDEGVTAGGAFNVIKKWPKRTLEICFLDGTRELRRYVAGIARQWTLYGAVDFDFGDWNDPRNCNADPFSSDVRVTFNQPGDWAFVGTDRIDLGATLSLQSATLSLQSVGSDEFSKIKSGQRDRAILHEFGHALGFEHNWMAPSAECNDEMDWAYVYKSMAQDYGFTRADVDHTLRSPTSREHIVGAFDRRSVMNWELPSAYYKKGKQSKCFAAPMNELSLRDKLAVYKNYQ
jgi:hypothetical protein